MFSSAFRRALTVAVHSSSSTEPSHHSTADPINIVKQSETSTTELDAFERTPIYGPLSEEDKGETGVLGSSERLGSIESLSYKALPDLPLCMDAGTSSSVDIEHSHPTTSIVTGTLTVEHEIHNSNDTRTAAVFLSISQMHELPTSSIHSDLPPPYNIKNQTFDTTSNGSSQRNRGPVVGTQLSDSSPSATPLTSSSIALDSVERDSVSSHTPSNSGASHSDSQTIEEKKTISSAKLRTRKSTSSFSSFLHNIAVSNTNSSTVLPLADHDSEEMTRRRKRTPNTLPILQPIVETNPSNFTFSASPKSSGSPLTSNIRGPDTSFARRMEEAGRLRRLQSQSNIKGDARKTMSASDSHASAQSPSVEPQVHLKSYSEDEAKAEGRMLRDLLDRTLRELKDTRDEAERVTAQITWEKSRLVQELKSSNDDILSLRKESEAQRHTIIDLRSQLKSSETDLNVLKKEKRTWQDQLDGMHHKVVHAERRIRCLDNLTHSKLESRMEGAFGPTRRSAKAAVTKDASAEVVGAVVALNEEILQTSNLLVEILERTHNIGSNANILRAKAVVGDTITSMMQSHRSGGSNGFRFLLMQAALEAFMVHWSTYIIEGWYPRQQSFADLLIDLSSQVLKPNALPNTKAECGRVKILETTSSMAEKFPEWVSDIIQDLWKILSAGGLRLRPNRSDLLTSKLLIIVKMAYDVRTALAEKDICGHLDLVVINPDIPFREKWMDQAHHNATGQRKSPTSTETELVASTSGLGLQRLPADTNGEASKSTPTMILKPKVVLTRVLEESS